MGSTLLAPSFLQDVSDRYCDAVGHVYCGSSIHTHLSRTGTFPFGAESVNFRSIELGFSAVSNLGSEGECMHGKFPPRR